MVRLRENRNLNASPPSYKPGNEYLTFVFHYGGKLEVNPFAQYVGGNKLVVDYVVASNVTLLYLQNLVSDWLFIDGEVRLFILNDNHFMRVLTNDEVIQLCLSSLTKREAVFFIQEGPILQGPVLEENVGEESDDDLDAMIDDFSSEPIIEKKSNLESEFVSSGQGPMPSTGDECHASDSDYIVVENSDDEDDDLLFDKNVSKNVEEGNGTDSSEEDDDVVNVDALDEYKDSDGENEQPIYHVFNPKVIFEPDFELGMIFSSTKEFKLAVQSHAIRAKRTVIFTKIAPERIYAKCENEKCKWKIHLNKHRDEETFQVGKFMGVHTCVEQRYVKNLKSSWLSKKYMPTFVTERNRKVKVLRQDMMNELGCHISKEQTYRAKELALKKLEGDADIQYAKLWDYAEEVRSTNPGSTVIIGTGNDDGRFERLYMCLGAVKAGFKAGCRPIIGIDGCHLTSKFNGVLLAAVGVDANNSIYPIAWSVVNRETRETWEWFLVVLKQDLGIVNDAAITFMSDKQKGLIQAMSNVFPNAEHRFCLRHLHGNFKLAGFRGETFKTALLSASHASTVGEWKQRMLDLKRINEEAWKWLDGKPPHQWSKSHFTENCKCDMVLNNVCEVFNATILEARQMPILTMLEWIRLWLMVRFQKHRDFSTPKWNGRICPRIKGLLEKNAGMASNCIPIKGDNRHYEIRCHDGGQFIVDLAKWSCSCRLWGLSGIPCKHAISAISDQQLNREDFVHECYTVETFKKTYAGTIIGVNGPQLWNDSNIIPALPPHMVKGKGKQSKKRVKGPDEKAEKMLKKKYTTKLKRKQSTVTCSKCGVQGHNSATCGKEKVKKIKKRRIPNENGTTDASITQESIHVSQVCDEEDPHSSEIPTQHSQVYVPCPSMMQQLWGGSSKGYGGKK